MSGRASPYAGMSHADLIRLRDSLPENDPRQAEIAPYEHAAFAREWTEENPLLAVPSLAVAIPGYTVAKAMGLTHARSPATLAEIRMGYAGVKNGLIDLMRPRRTVNALAEQSRE